MKSELSGKERIDRILSGLEIDRPAVSAWRHFYERENTGPDLVKSMMEFQARFEWDFIKINSRASYHVEDWGVEFEFSSDPLIKPVGKRFPVETKSDWMKIKPLDWRKGSLGEVLKAGEEIVRQAGPDIYCLPTVFAPLSIAADLVVSDGRFKNLLEDGPDELQAALNAISETFEGYVAEFLDIGMAGIFLATTEWATRDRLTEEQYLEFGRPYDLRILKAASSGVVNVMHVCKSNNMLPLFRDYPVPILSWNPFGEGNLTISQAAQISDKLFMTGVDQNGTLRQGPARAISEQIMNSLAEVLPGRLIAAPGCAVKVDTPESNLRALADTVKGWKP